MAAINLLGLPLGTEGRRLASAATAEAESEEDGE